MYIYIYTYIYIYKTLSARSASPRSLGPRTWNVVQRSFWRIPLNTFVRALPFPDALVHIAMTKASECGWIPWRSLRRAPPISNLGRNPRQATYSARGICMQLKSFLGCVRVAQMYTLVDPTSLGRKRPRKAEIAAVRSSQTCLPFCRLVASSPNHHIIKWIGRNESFHT